jgi:hypothetical protein
MFSVALRVDSLVVHIAWAFLVLRALHSAIHLTYNDVKHRLVAFALGNVALGTQVG